MSLDANSHGNAVAARRDLMRVCSQATQTELADAVATFGADLVVTDVRAPETGLVMLRGRIGGDGAPFNVGEATVTRVVVQLASGELGYAFRLGRAGGTARLAATLDALIQTTDTARERINNVFIKPVTARVASDHARARAKTNATRVDFFTLARGED